MSQNWDCFLWSADEWIVNYSLPPNMTGTKLFSIGHALELYLKATYSKMTGDVDEAVRIGHNMRVRITTPNLRQTMNFGHL